ncbi:hypothetical protein [Natrinema salsiterrestre]|uniref:Uncharacterized protein n=1 Tax=Natrinema salsiterrestre TaxID=2950540 RepID=A0A9Q4Q1Z0_9EURY|nr:hypothetical protein [Natrinema salsiterrestre]MDF9747779.1 hypothetical protein [Natrinema salsiterrestre]
MALAVIGGTSLAGCSDENPDQSESSNEDTTSTNSVNPAQLIEAHSEAVADTNYTVFIEKYRAEEQDPRKGIEYRYDPAENHSWISETSILDERSSNADQYFTESTQEVALGLDGEVQNRSELAINNGPLFINGASVFDRLLVGAELQPLDGGDADQSTSRYQITGNRQFDAADGTVRIGDNDIIEELDVEWEVSGTTLTLHYEMTDIGSTSIESVL